MSKQSDSEIVANWVLETNDDVWFEVCDQYTSLTAFIKGVKHDYPVLYAAIRLKYKRNSEQVRLHLIRFWESRGAHA